MSEQSTTQIDAELPQEIVTEEPKQPEAKQENSYNELPDWARRRMGELAAEKNAAKQKLEELQSKQQYQAPQDQQNYIPQDNIQELAMTYAKQIAAQQAQEQSFVNRMSEIEKNAKEEFGDVYDKSVTNLQLAGVGGQDFLQALAAIPSPEKVITFLGKSENINEAIRIANLNPLQMGVELTKLSTKATKELGKQKSNAPAPVGDVDGGSSRALGTVEPDPSDTEAWLRWRSSNARKRR
jgi:hypothetical protein